MDENEGTRDAASLNSKVLLLGGLVGALLGVGAAYLFLQQAEKESRPVRLTPGEGVKLGLLALGTLKQVSQLGSEEKGKKKK